MGVVGFMQGRLSPIVDGKIQSFPRGSWQEEFYAAQGARFDLVEWTLDYEYLFDNPFMTNAGRAAIRNLVSTTGCRVQSVTGDCFMQSPFWKSSGTDRVKKIKELLAVIEACGLLKVKIIVLPLVDNGSVLSHEELLSLHDGLFAVAPSLKNSGVQIAFESDYPPETLLWFINLFPSSSFGINYDIGNSASLGYSPEEEIEAYGSRILNVHVKDRMLGGTTVPLGEGSADFPLVFCKLREVDYAGNYILQTARAADGDHLAALIKYRNQVQEWLAL
jgi:L-ribulose-5-phosphate 3-epimerase